MDATLADPLVGQVLNERYRVESLIARGGMSTVYVGRDLKLERAVALKIMHPNLAADDDFVRRFIGEAKSAAALSHPNVVAVYDQGTDKGHVYLAMEYVPGRTLRDLLDQVGRLGPRAALQVIQPVLSALGAAHRAGMVHRDVKPENVLLTGDNRIKVVDFGLARAVAAGHQTKTGILIGTVGYLAPEQVVNGTADARSDVYAAGILLFELITGLQPHRGETPMAVAYKHVNEVVPLPSSVVPGLPPVIDALVAAATNRDPGRRPADANHFSAAVGDAHRNLPADVDAATAQVTPVQPQAPQGPATGALPPLPGGPAHGGPGVPGVPGGAAPTAVHPGLPAGPGAAGHPGADGFKTAVVPRPQAQPVPDRLTAVLASRYLYIALGTVVVLVLGWVVWYQTAGRYVEVPQLTGRSVADAQALVENSGLTIKIGTAVYDEKVPRNHVVRTEPPAFKELAKGAEVTVVPSKGPEPVPVPDVKGMPLAQAQQTLAANRLKPGKVRKEFSLDIPPGNVIKTDPETGKKQQRDVPVTIVVSEGIKIPNMKGWSREDAENQLRAWGLNPLVEERDDPNQQPGTVLEQDPPPDTGLKRGDPVKLIVSKPPGGFQLPCPPFCQNRPDLAGVPGVVGKPVRDAIRELQQAGFQVEVRRAVGRRQVVAQNPRGGTQVPKGSRVVIWR
jgi:beta-lactam-binding protein with PASTA domain/predicted Ser/Thr protein kinase